MKKELSTKKQIIAAAVMTAIASYCNMNLMIAPNPIDPLCVILSAAALILWAVVIARAVKRAENLKRTMGLVLGVLLVLILSGALGYLWADSDQLPPEWVYIFYPGAFLSVLPFVGIIGMLEQVDIPAAIKAISPYIVLLAACFVGKSRRKAEPKKKGE